MDLHLSEISNFLQLWHLKQLFLSSKNLIQLSPCTREIFTMIYNILAYSKNVHKSPLDKHVKLLLKSEILIFDWIQVLILVIGNKR